MRRQPRISRERLLATTSRRNTGFETTNGRRRFPAFVRVSILIVASGVLFAACSRADPESERQSIRRTVRVFFTALETADGDTLRSVAPAIAEAAPGALAQITAGLGEIEMPEIGEPEITGRRATVAVTLPVPNQSEATTLIVPLRKRRGDWIIDSTLAITQTFDVIRFSD